MINGFQSAESQPSNATVDGIAALWREVLRTNEPLDMNDDFFALGGDSMTMVMLQFRIQEEFSVNLAASAVLEAPTLGELSALVDAARTESQS